jgi:hypothetical protein
MSWSWEGGLQSAANLVSPGRLTASTRLAEEHGQEQFLDGKGLGRRTRFGTGLAAAASCPRTGSTGEVTQLMSQTIYRLRGRFGLLNLTQALIAAPGWGGGHWHEKRLTCRVLGTRPE